MLCYLAHGDNNLAEQLAVRSFVVWLDENEAMFLQHVHIEKGDLCLFQEFVKNEVRLCLVHCEA